MQYNVDKALKSYHNVRTMLKKIPRQLWYIFLPDTIGGLHALESSVMALRPREVDRQKVMAIQLTCNFPLRPNAPLHEIAARLKILKLKKSGFGNSKEDGSDVADSQ